MAENRFVPRHIAIIMDGNGRWAKKRGMPRTMGHAAGAEAFRRTANYCRTLGVEYLTVYAFSTENWKRPKEEVDAIMQLLEKYLKAQENQRKVEGQVAEKYSKVLPMDKVAKLYVGEEKFRRNHIRKLHGSPKHQANK